ncbi:methyl-accepting chemotaxis protein [Hydrogenispora ethanolica]|uniref:Methyl-accepting chemotaxis protein n=1 Tax=Hydrogenispora ethanolica TaxID=1082276 RepID=A0A4R1RA27_HYDET|nr:methyl-accepting chemotaxis protein [Hydrogenispora ethanolica]TCL62565.1 methyl-accepting chemotaxis protein [Hydrogenispora ethanolica]
MKKRLQFNSIKLQITVSVVAIITAVCIGLAASSYLITSAGMKTNLDQSLQEITSQAANTVEGRISKYFSQLKSLAEVDLFQDFTGNKDKIMALLTKVTEDSGHVSMTVADTRGDGWNTDGDTVNIADREYFKQIMQGRDAISDPLLSKTTGKMVVIQGVPLKNKAQKIIGVLLLSSDGDGLSKIIADVGYGKEGKAFMINKQGTSIAHYDREKVMKQDNIFEDVKTDPGLQELANAERRMVAGEKGAAEYRYQGVVKYIAFCPVPGTGWSLALTTPKSEVFASLNHMRNIVLLISLIFLVVGGVISYFLAYQISNPIEIAVAHLGGVAIGNLEINAPEVFLARSDEIGKLAHAVQNITEDLREKASAAKQIAGGDLNVRLTMKSEQDVLTQNLNIMAQNIHHVIEDINMLAGAAIEGDLSVRADAERHDGDYRKIVTGINETLDAIILPLNDANEILQKLSVNDYTSAIQADKYQGMLRQFAENINLVRSQLLTIQDYFIKVSEGDISRLEELRKTGKRSENDQMVPAVMKMMQAIRDLIAEVNRISEAAVGGDLKIRGNSEQFEGGYREIVGGFNRSLDAIIEPIDETSEVLQEMATGNLTVEVSENYRGDHAILAQAVNKTIDSFNEVLGEFHSASSQVASGAQQVSASSQVMSQAASEQASTTEEITSSMTEIATQTKRNAESATQANHLAKEAQEQARAGNEQMQKMLESMKTINESSTNISKIIKVIDEIAFQTNILALNAAVEAARAGQHGKGFAVVAEEVRNLAARSANAAKETTGMIESSIQRVEAGTRIANETAESLERIVNGITKAADLVRDIAIASNEQATGISQVNQGINQIAQVTQTNTATSQQSAATSEELAGQAEMLKEMVQRFKLKNAVERPASQTETRKLPKPAEQKISARMPFDDGKY